MNVASFELCKELYELSGWGHRDGDHTFDKWYVYNEKSDFAGQIKRYTEREWDEWADENGLNIDGDFFPAYDLGYILRELPHRLWDEKNKSWTPMTLACWERGVTEMVKIYTAEYHTVFNVPMFRVEADTPENAACKLSIELAKQGLLESGK